MDSAPQHERYSSSEKSSSIELGYLFSVVEERFNEASEKQTQNTDSPFYTVEVLNDKTYYGMTFAKSYLDLITRRNYSEKFEVLVPALMADVEVPFAEQINENESASFLIRKSDRHNNPVYLNATTTGFKGGKKEIVKAYKQFFSDKVPKEDRVYKLAEIIRDYELIPSNVSPRYSLAELLLRHSGVEPTDA